MAYDRLRELGDDARREAERLEVELDVVLKRRRHKFKCGSFRRLLDNYRTTLGPTGVVINNLILSRSTMKRLC